MSGLRMIGVTRTQRGNRLQREYNTTEHRITIVIKLYRQNLHTLRLDKPEALRLLQPGLGFSRNDTSMFTCRGSRKRHVALKYLYDENLRLNQAMTRKPNAIFM